MILTALANYRSTFREILRNFRSKNYMNGLLILHLVVTPRLIFYYPKIWTFSKASESFDLSSKQGRPLLNCSQWRDRHIWQGEEENIRKGCGYRHLSRRLETVNGQNGLDNVLYLAAAQLKSQFGYAPVCGYKKIQRPQYLRRNSGLMSK